MVNLLQGQPKLFYICTRVQLMPKGTNKPRSSKNLEKEESESKLSSFLLTRISQCYFHNIT